MTSGARDDEGDLAGNILLKDDEARQIAPRARWSVLRSPTLRRARARA